MHCVPAIRWYAACTISLLQPKYTMHKLLLSQFTKNIRIKEQVLSHTVIPNWGVRSWRFSRAFQATDACAADPWSQLQSLDHCGRIQFGWSLIFVAVTVHRAVAKHLHPDTSDTSDTSDTL